jgi:hypothetical protein
MANNLTLCFFLLSFCCVLGSDYCAEKKNLCHVISGKVSCVEFTGRRLLLACAGLGGEEVIIPVTLIK